MLQWFYMLHVLFIDVLFSLLFCNSLRLLKSCYWASNCRFPAPVSVWLLKRQDRWMDRTLSGAWEAVQQVGKEDGFSWIIAAQLQSRQLGVCFQRSVMASVHPERAALGKTARVSSRGSEAGLDQVEGPRSWCVIQYYPAAALEPPMWQSLWHDRSDMYNDLVWENIKSLYCDCTFWEFAFQGIVKSYITINYV